MYACVQAVLTSTITQENSQLSYIWLYCVENEWIGALLDFVSSFSRWSSRSFFFSSSSCIFILLFMFYNLFVSLVWFSRASHCRMPLLSFNIYYLYIFSKVCFETPKLVREKEGIPSSLVRTRIVVLCSVCVFPPLYFTSYNS